MENIERTQFVVLTGHTQEQPLPDLIRRLRVQRKTGRLQVEYADGPGSFFFEDGQMVDARLGELRGVEALYAALALEGGSFNFNPLVRPPERNIDRQGQQFIRDLIEAPRREGLAEIRVAGSVPATREHATLPERAPLQLGPGAEELLTPLQARLSAVEGAIEQTARRFSRERLVYGVVIGFLVGLSFVTTLHVLYGPFFGPRAESATDRPAPTADAPAVKEQTTVQPAPAPNSNAKTEASTAAPPPVPTAAAVVGSRRFDGAPAPRREYVVEVLVEVKDGRVTDARVWNPRPGAAPYEAVALKMARERSYPESFNGGERVRIRVKP